MVLTHVRSCRLPAVALNRKTLMRALSMLLALAVPTLSIAETIKLGLLHPTTGRYQNHGFEIARGALLAIEEINASGGVLGRELELLTENTASLVERTDDVVDSLIDQQADVLLGAAASDVAIAAGKRAADHNKLFFATLSYADETTGAEGHRHIFRETPSAWMTAKALSFYLNQQLPGKKVFYLTADYTWGHSIEKALRQVTRTTNQSQHPGVNVPYPRPRRIEIHSALMQAETSEADVLVVSQLGDDMATTLQLAHDMGLKGKMQIVVPNLTQSMAMQAGAAVMEGVVGTVPWSWQVPFEFGYQRGQNFVTAYSERFDEQPDSPAASAYSTVYQIRDAIEDTGSLSTRALIQALEGKRYTLLKDPQTWRGFDHQNLQSLYVVRCKPRDEVVQSPMRSDHFEILLHLPATMSARPLEEWQQTRAAAGQPLQL